MYSFVPTDVVKVQILDHTGQLGNTIAQLLADYRERWNESIASNIIVISSLDEVVDDVPIILAKYKDSESVTNEKLLLNILSELSIYNLRRFCIDPKVNLFTDIDLFMEAVSNLPATIACDFEAASKYTDEEKAVFKEQLELVDDVSKEGIELRQKISSSGLSHPELVRITHLSIATAEDESYVLAMTEAMEIPVCEWLVSIDNLQVWHNLSFDAKLIYNRTGRLPKNYDDSMLMWWTVLNNADTTKAKVGLKTLASNVYADWGEDIKEKFNLAYIYDYDLNYYAGIDTQACLYLHTEILRHPEFQDDNLKLVTIENLLPESNPKDIESRKSKKYFYYNVVRTLIEPTVRLMMQGINIDPDKVNELRGTILKVLKSVEDRLAKNPKIQEYQMFRYSKLKKEYIADRESKQRETEYYTKEFDVTKMEHRSYLMNYLSRDHKLPYLPTAQLPDGELKWSVADVKKLQAIEPNEIYEAIIDKTIDKNHRYCIVAMRQLAIRKADIYNRKYKEDILAVSPETLLPPFNAGSSLQKAELFEYLDIPCEKFSKLTDLASWSRGEVTRVNKSTTDEDVKDFTQAFIDHSFSAIIKTNFIAAFDTYSVNGRLYGNYRLGGALSFRYTSNSPNLLNMPSTGSIFSKPLKKCFAAKKDYIICSSDFGALQEVTIANITEDATKIKLIGGGFDSHCFHSTNYYPRIEEILGKDDGTLEWNKNFKTSCKTNEELSKLRQTSKGVSFKLVFGGFPDSHKGGNITQEIFDKYHNVLYPGVTKYNNEVVMGQAKKEGEAYLGLGLSVKTNNPRQHQRTVCNATAQFWDVISAITMAEMNKRIDTAGYKNEIALISTIYDSLYYEVKNDPTIVKWLNDNLIEVMTQQMFIYQPVPNNASMVVGNNWAEENHISNNASIEEIEETLAKLKE